MPGNFRKIHKNCSECYIGETWRSRS